MPANARRFRQSRDQLYHLKVAVEDIRRTKMPAYPTPELEATLSILEYVCEQSCEAFMAGDVLAFSLDRFTPLALPGFEEIVEEMKSPLKRSED